MNKLLLYTLAGSFLLSVFSAKLNAQASACPAVNAGIDQTICGGCTNLTATVQGTVSTSSYTGAATPYNPYSYTAGPQVLVNIDDIWTSVITMPFCFEFYGNTYSQLVIGSNGLISFNTGLASGYCEWDIMAAMPNTSAYDNCIMAPYHDIDPSIGASSEVHYNTYGTAPCREFVVSWYNVPMYSGACNSLLASQQIVLHESTNIIDIYIANKPLCASWNEGGAVEGIINLGGTQSVIVPGRNYPTQWTAVNDGYRFVPAGAPNYTISWTGPSGPLGTTNTINVCPTTTTTYTATVTNTSCAGPIVVSDVVTVTINSTLSASMSSTPTACTANNGTATAVPSGGSGNYSYSWAPSGGTSSVASGLGAGTYTVTITDITTGCVTTQTISVTQAGGITTTSSQNNPLCSGGVGSASVNVSGGTGPYTYNWSSGGTGPTENNLTCGVYTCTVTDMNGCTSTQSFNLTCPPALQATTSQTNVMCFGDATGCASVAPSGGTPGYTYSWMPTGGTSAQACNLTAGTYFATITDANGCTFTTSVTIGEPPQLTITMTTTPVNCATQGSATATPSGGIAGYTYSWSSGGTGATESNLAVGTYTVTVTDANGCTQTQTATVTQVARMSVTATSTDVTCFGGSTGTASVTPNGGNAPFTYQWSPTGGNNAQATGLATGSYTCLITDANGCTATQTVFITEPTQVLASASSTPASCFASSDGTITGGGSGGVPPYSYSYSPSGPANVPAGTYTVTVTDGNGCTATQSVVVTQPTAITASSSTSAPTCNGGSNGSATVTPSGGNGPYTYSWAPTGGTGSTASGLAAGGYICTITDANGCTITPSLTVTQPPAITATGTGNQVCPGNNATLIVTQTGGTAPYTYVWSNGPTTATQTLVASSSTTGIYTVTVTDANGCTGTATAAVSMLPTPTAAYTTDAPGNIVVLTAGAGQICFTDASTGGAVSWQWNFGGIASSTQQAPCFPVTSANAGTFCTELIVADANGCADTTEACVEIGQSSYSIPNVFTPNADGTNDAWIITNEGMTSLHCAIYDRWGALVYEWDGTTGNWDGKTTSGKEAVDGTYYYVARLVDFTDKVYEEQGFFQLINAK